MGAGTRRERGQAAVVVLGALIVLLALMGLAVDATRFLVARRDLHNAADSAALAGAQALAEEWIYSPDRAKLPVLDPGSARSQALASLAAASPEGIHVEVEATRDGVRVRLRQQVPTFFLRLIGIPSESIGAEALARPRAGPVP